MSNQVQNAPSKNEEKLKGVLGSMVQRSLSVFPKGINAELLKINALTYIEQNPALLEIAQKQPLKIAQIVYNFIALGLDMSNRECYIIPFGSTLTVLKDYKGEVKLARKYSVDPIREIFARVVYQNDTYYHDDLDRFIHKFDPFSLERGEKIGAYCTVVYETGVRQTEFVNIDEINKVRAASKSSKSDASPWNTWEEEMWRKTAIRKAMKNISLDFGSSEASAAYRSTDNDVDFNSGNRSIAQPIKEQNDAFDNVIESEAKEVNIHDI